MSDAQASRWLEEKKSRLCGRWKTHLAGDLPDRPSEVASSEDLLGPYPIVAWIQSHLFHMLSLVQLGLDSVLHVCVRYTSLWTLR